MTMLNYRPHAVVSGTLGGSETEGGYATQAEISKGGEHIRYDVWLIRTGLAWCVSTQKRDLDADRLISP